MHGPLFERTTRGHAELNVAVVASPPLRVLALLAQRGDVDPRGHGPGAPCCAHPLTLMESCISECKEVSVIVVSPVGLPPGMYKDAWLGQA